MTLATRRLALPLPATPCTAHHFAAEGGMTAPMQHDAYLAALPDAQAALLFDLRRHLSSILPGAEEVISYAMPGFRIGKVVVAGYAGFARNCGFYPHAGNIIPAFKAELDTLGLRHTPGAVLFNPERPLPHDLVTRIVAARLAAAGLTDPA